MGVASIILWPINVDSGLVGAQDSDGEFRKQWGSTSCECSSEVLCASVLVKSGLENRDFGRRGSVALTMRNPSIRKSWH
jgi:hypothetical protein